MKTHSVTMTKRSSVYQDEAPKARCLFISSLMNPESHYQTSAYSGKYKNTHHHQDHKTADVKSAIAAVFPSF